MKSMEKIIKKSKRCDICRKPFLKMEEAVLLFGQMMQKSNISVHYYCLLLSTNLVQRGQDCGGINGFFLADIRKEIIAAGERCCAYCNAVGASVSCHNCKIYFDTQCGQRNGCLFQYKDDFKSFCDECITYDEIQLEAKSNWKLQKCLICKDILGYEYSPVHILYSPCCQKGFFHKICIQKYAMSAGYYLRCIICGDQSFREKICLQGVFVPDREARWESKTAYRDMHRGHQRCDMEHCFNPRGREHQTAKWKLINCVLCGSFGTHLECLPQSKYSKVRHGEDFKCETCANTEMNVTACLSNSVQSSADDLIDTSIFVHKQWNEDETKTHSETPTFSEDENIAQNETSLDILNITENVHMGDQQIRDSAIPYVLEYIVDSKRIRIEHNPMPDETSNSSNVIEPTLTQSSNLPIQCVESQEEPIQCVDESQEETIKCVESQEEPIQCVESQEEPKKCVESQEEPIKCVELQEEPIKCVESQEEPTKCVESQKEPIQCVESPQVPPEKVQLSEGANPLDNTENYIKKPTETLNFPEIPTAIFEESFNLQSSTSQTTHNPTQSPILTINSSNVTLTLSKPIQDKTEPQEASNKNNFVEFEMYEFTHDHEIIGSCKLRLNMNSPRFEGKSIEEIQDTPGLILEKDIIERTNDIGVFRQINDYLDSIIN